MESSGSISVALDVPAGGTAALVVDRIAYHGWSDCYRIANSLVEAIVVPAIGRVMQLRLVNQEAGTFWENRALDGQTHATASPDSASQDPAAKDASSAAWINFGGDKCWPAPQSEWLKLQGHGWPPPAAFDSLPATATVVERGLLLTTALDPAFGIEAVRRIELDPLKPVLTIRSEFRKLSGEPLRVAVWSITQMNDPEAVCLILPRKSRFSAGYTRILETEPYRLRRKDRLLSLARHPGQYVKIGSDATSLLWVGPQAIVRMDVNRRPGEYPDGGCVTEVYTNPNPLPYVELETLGPLTSLAPGNSAALTTTYTVTPRTSASAEADAHKAIENIT